ncbi:MAG: hypothetical protein AMXMBFR81_21880 [Chthonomonas sp.]
MQLRALTRILETDFVVQTNEVDRSAYRCCTTCKICDDLIGHIGPNHIVNKRTQFRNDLGNIRGVRHWTGADFDFWPKRFQRSLHGLELALRLLGLDEHDFLELWDMSLNCKKQRTKRGGGDAIPEFAPSRIKGKCLAIRVSTSNVDPFS